MSLEDLATELEDTLTDLSTWLPDAVRDGERDAVWSLRELCDDILSTGADDVEADLA